MGRIDFFLGVLVCLLVVPALTPGFSRASVLERSNFSLTGSVSTEGANQHIALARVMLCDEGGDVLFESMTDESGAFSFQGLRPGRYILRVTANGFQPVDLPVDLSFTCDRGLFISLKPLRTDSPALPARDTISAHELTIPEAARNLFASGKNKLYADKDSQAALRDFQSATERAPGFYEAYYQAGMAYLALQKEVEAEKQFRKAVDLSQNKYPDANIALGTILLNRNEVAEGEALLRSGVAASPNSWPGQFELGKLDLSRGQIETALAAAQKAAALAPHQPVVYRLLAAIYLRQKDYASLASALDSYIELDANSPAGVRAKELRAEAQRQLDSSPREAVAVK
jgi:Flp pilus assembly protein TadD